MKLLSSTLLLFACCLAGPRCSKAFLLSAPENHRYKSSSIVVAAAENDKDGSLFDDLQMRARIFQESNQKGYGMKQSMANVLAGEYDQEAIQAKIDETIASAPCVMFAWERSPSCVQAKEAFETMGISDQVKVVPLDDPWDKGNPIRAELGKRVGRSSVPCIFIGGNYVGGFDGGVSDQAPGIQTMAFQGKLRPALEAAGIKFADQQYSS